jgi:hypothetical protein
MTRQVTIDGQPGKPLDCDYLAALLSTDWFLPYWGELNLVATIESRRRVQAGVRQIVKQFMQGATTYSSIDLALERRTKTCEQLQRILSEHAGLQLDDLTAGAEDQNKTLFWLLETITLEVVKRSNPDLSLSSAQFAAISSTFELTLGSEQPLDLEPICISSGSNWDRYIGALFEGQPTWLTDWLLSLSFESSRFGRFWSLLSSKLAPSDLAAIRSWYSNKIRELADEGFDGSLPAWMRA